MTARQFASLASEVFGNCWQAGAAKFFGVASTTIWRYANGVSEVPPDRADKLRREAREKIKRVNAALAA